MVRLEANIIGSDDLFVALPTCTVVQAYESPREMIDWKGAILKWRDRATPGAFRYFGRFEVLVWDEEGPRLHLVGCREISEEQAQLPSEVRTETLCHWLPIIAAARL